MLVPEQMNESLLAPCGMNCLLCYKHLGAKPCPGCFCGDENKPNSCRSCKIRDCALAKGLRHCARCADFPCGQINLLDKSYRTRYGISLIEAGKVAVRDGIKTFLQGQIAQYTCPACGGLISMHDGDCSNCKKQYSLGKGRERNPVMDIAELVAGLQGPDHTTAHAYLQVLQRESVESDALYHYFDTFTAMLGSCNSYLRARGLLLIVACARWDVDNKIDEIIDDCLTHIMDIKPTVSRQFISALPELARYKPDLAEDIRRALHNANPARYRDSMAPLVQQDIAKALAAIG